MQGLWRQILLHIRLNFRNRMALIYQYIFPTIFLIAFRTLYRQEQSPLPNAVGVQPLLAKIRSTVAREAETSGKDMAYSKPA